MNSSESGRWLLACCWSNVLDVSLAFSVACLTDVDIRFWRAETL
jgi:hypothetical protein